MLILDVIMEQVSGNIDFWYFNDASLIFNYVTWFLLGACNQYFYQNLNYYYTLNEKNIFALEAQHLIKDEDPFYNAILENNENYQITATGLGLDNSLPFYNIAQEKKVRSNQLDAKIDYWNILNKKSDINLTFGTIYSKQEFDSDIFQFLSNSNENTYNPTPSINNGLDFNDVSYVLMMFIWDYTID